MTCIHLCSFFWCIWMLLDTYFTARDHRWRPGNFIAHRVVWVDESQENISIWYGEGFSLKNFVVKGVSLNVASYLIDDAQGFMEGYLMGKYLPHKMFVVEKDQPETGSHGTIKLQPNSWSNPIYYKKNLNHIYVEQEIRVGMRYHMKIIAALKHISLWCSRLFFIPHFLQPHRSTIYQYHEIH